MDTWILLIITMQCIQSKITPTMPIKTNWKCQIWDHWNWTDVMFYLAKDIGQKTTIWKQEGHLREVSWKFTWAPGSPWTPLIPLEPLSPGEPGDPGSGMTSQINSHLHNDSVCSLLVITIIGPRVMVGLVLYWSSKKMFLSFFFVCWRGHRLTDKLITLW